MKQVLFSLLLIAGFSLSAQQTEKAPIPVKTAGDLKKEAVIKQAQDQAAAEVVIEKTNAVMTFESLTVDYGTIENGGEPVRLVKFTNTGTDPLVIKNARGSCGCTVPTWPKEPIAPGQSSVMEIRYDTKRTGKINKSVTITTNEGPDNHVLQVIGEVLPVKEEKAVPVAEPNIIKGN
ncbi:MAG: DUF1573 domain-containing protein [Saprospiraceae bacterium]|nr:DUF1573 domain-containing protein [Saprospiraceae bacterium]